MRLGAAAHQHDALDDIVVAVMAGDAEPRFVADREVATSLTSTGEPSRTVSMVLRMSSIDADLADRSGSPPTAGRC